MDDLFSSCTRMRDILVNRCLDPPEGLQELNLNLSTEELLSADRAFTYADLFAMLGNKSTVAWITPHTYVTYGMLLDGSCRSCFNADGKVLCGLARSTEHLLEICDVILRLLAASVVHSVTLHNWYHRDGTMINAASLAYLMEQCLSLKALTLEHLKLDQDHCRVLGTYSRPDLEIVLDRCKLTSAGASALAEVLGRNQGPTKLVVCNVDNIVLADGLRGNSRLKRLRPQISNSREVEDRQFLAIAGALRDNKGLVDLNLNSCLVSDETWNAICDSLKTHPTLEFLDLRVYFTNTTTAPAVITSRMQALENMMKVNTSIHTLHLDSRFSEHELHRESIVPYLATNRHRSHVRAIQKTRPFVYRAKVLGQALFAARTDPNRFWMLLSGNAEVTFPSTTATIAAATNLLEPRSASASSNTAAVTITSAVTVTAIRAASTTDASAVDIIASPTDCQLKRKARP
jgi:hypothetical protein